MTTDLRTKLIQKGWVTEFNADTLTRLIEEHYAALADEPAVPEGREPAAVAERPSDEELRDLWSWAAGQDQGPWPTQYHCFARAVLARFGHQSAPPADGEVAKLVQHLHHAAEVDGWNGASPEWCQSMLRAAELLQRQVMVPVPVSERLQQMEDLAADAVAGLRYIEQSHGRLYGVGWDRVYKKADQLKPAHALPLPGQEVEG